MTAPSQTPSEAWDGVPKNPERDGWHWVSQNGATKPTLWEALEGGDHGWRNPGTWGGWFRPRWFVGEGFHYLGPVLTPTDRDALQQRVRELEGENERLRATQLRIIHTESSPLVIEE